ncbi:MAG: polyprenyl synthetase family protein [Terriglobia bacterium]
MTAAYPHERQAVVEEALRSFLPRGSGRPDVVHKAIEHSLLSGGKRFRPVLCVIVAEMLGANPDEILPTAVAIEFIHTYSLIHDDLPAIDNDSLRRGRPTCHVVFGEDVAILAGDALFSEAFFLIASAQRADADLIRKVVLELAAAAGLRGMVKGQVADIFYAGREIDEDVVDFIHQHKTGRLITASARVAAILAGSTEAELEVLTRYADYLGLAFQITDDILDEVGEESKVGKRVRKDQELRKATFPKVFGLDGAADLARTSIEKAKDALSRFDERADPLRNLAEFVLARDS